MGIEIVSSIRSEATSISSDFGFSKGSSRFRVAFKGFEDRNHWVAAKENDPCFLTRWYYEWRYIPIQQADRTVWLNEKSLIKRFSNTTEGRNFLKTNFQDLYKTWFPFSQEESPALVQETLPPPPPKEELSYEEKLKKAIEFCARKGFLPDQINDILQDSSTGKPGTVISYLDSDLPHKRLLHISSPDKNGKIKKYLLMVDPEKDRSLGSGTYGTVYFAIDLETARIHVVKKFVGEESIRELQTLQKLREKLGIVQVQSWFYYGPNRFIIMEFCDQGDLESFIRKAELNYRPTFSFMQSLYLLFDYAYGLYSTHQTGIVHRDIKGPNLLLKGNDFFRRGKICDFGLAAPPESIEDYQVGTTVYFSPEQCKAQPKLDYKKNDIWALAVTTYNLFHPQSKTLPHMSRHLPPADVYEDCANLEQEDLERSINHLHPAVKGLFKMMLVVDPNKRADSGAVLQEIIRIGQSEGFLMPVYKNIPGEYYTPYTKNITL